MRSSVVLAAVAAATVSAQTEPQNFTSSLNMTISNPAEVPLQTRASWCRAQTNTCGTLCSSNTATNDCVLETLEYDCTCTANSSAPGLQFYTQTMPTFICQQLFSDCIQTNANDARGQEACTTNIESLCAVQEPPEAVAADDSEDSGDDSGAATTAASSSSVEPTSSPTDSGVSTTASDGFAAPTLSPFGNGAAAMAAVGLVAYLL